MSKPVIQRSPRHPMVVSGAIREHIERLQKKLIEPSYSLDRMLQLLDELDSALTEQQFADSLKLVQR